MAYSQQVDVRQRVKVTIDSTKMTPEWMSSFRETFYDFRTVDDHIRHLAQLYVRGIAYETCFIEGYGEAKEMGIKFEDIDQDEEIV
jgi:hypothetical protein